VGSRSEFGEAVALKKHHERTIALFVVLLCVLVFGDRLARWATPPPLVYENPIRVDVPDYRPGEPLRLTVRRCAHDPVFNQPVRSTFTRALVDEATGHRVALPGDSTVIPPGCVEVRSRQVVIPVDTQEGTYHLAGVSHAVNDWREYDAEWRTESFRVTR
jgi:hypothetical protein